MLVPTGSARLGPLPATAAPLRGASRPRIPGEGATSLDAARGPSAAGLGDAVAERPRQLELLNELIEAYLQDRLERQRRGAGDEAPDGAGAAA